MDYDYNRAIEYSKSELDNVKNVIKELEQYRESINQAINRVNKYFIGYEEVYRNSLKWAEYFKKDYIDFYNNIHKQLKKYGKISQKFSAIMLELGWPPSGKLYSEEKVEIVKAYDKFGAEGIKEKVDKYFIERFDFEELNNMFNIWSKKRWLSKRIPILKEALHAHFNKNYFSSIPTLLPQIEGAIADGYVGYLRGDTLKKLIKKLLNDEDEYSFDVRYTDILCWYNSRRF